MASQVQYHERVLDNAEQTFHNMQKEVIRKYYILHQISRNLLLNNVSETGNFVVLYVVTKTLVFIHKE